MWQLTGRGTDQSIARLIRAVVVRLARATGGGVEYWLKLPVKDLLEWMIELNEQLRMETAETEGG
jgi:type II secretory pathway component PulM